MNKANIKEKWGHYCDTNKLVDSMMDLLKTCNIENSEHGVCKVLDAYFTNKQDLIKMFAQSPNYCGDMRIVMDIEMERQNNAEEVDAFCKTFMATMHADKLLLKTTDANGKSRNDYINDFAGKLSPNDFLNEVTKTEITKKIENLQNFDVQGYSVKSQEDNQKLQSIFGVDFARHPSAALQQCIVDEAAKLPTPVTLAKDMKTSRAFNRICNTYGIDVLPNYNKVFAKYADMVSGLKRKLKFFISVNPLDYLTMSYGVNWTSCHSLKSGGYRGGTMSYMLDSTSFITYVHSEIPTDIEEGKIYREMFHYHKGNLIQGRIYPQENDGATDLYTFFGNIVCAELARLENKTNCWHRDTTISRDYLSNGAHYPDYAYHTFDHHYCLTGMRRCQIIIGNQRICTRCGKPIATSYRNALCHLSNETCELA